MCEWRPVTCKAFMVVMTGMALNKYSLFNIRHITTTSDAKLMCIFTLNQNLIFGL